MSALADIVINDLTQTMKTTLAPFIAKIESTNKHYQTLLDIMVQMPEYQQLVNENKQLKEELFTKSVKFVTPSWEKQTTRYGVKSVLEDIDHLRDTIIETRCTFKSDPEPVTLEPVTLEPVTLEPVTLEIIPIITSNVDIAEHVKQIYNTVTMSEEQAEEAEEQAEQAEEEEEAEEQAEQAEEEEEAEEEAEEQAEQAEEEEAEEEAEEECFVIEIDGVDYYTSNEESGDIYSVDSNDEVGDKVGKFVLGEPIML